MSLSLKSLNRAARNRLLKALRAEGIKPPRVGWCVRAFGGEVCRHPPYQIKRVKGTPGHGDTGYQIINVNFDPRRRRP